MVDCSESPENRDPTKDCGPKMTPSSPMPMPIYNLLSSYAPCDKTDGSLQSYYTAIAGTSMAPWITNSSSNVHPQTSTDTPFSDGSAAQPSYFYPHSSNSNFLVRSSSIDDSKSDWEVVLDDGTLQRRTVSLSTLPGPALPAEQYRAKIKCYDDQVRRSLQNEFGKKGCTANEYDEANDFNQVEDYVTRNTFVDERTGLLHHNNYTAYALQSSSSESDEEHLPKKRQTWLGRVWKLRKKLIPSYEQKMVLKCSFAFFLGSLFTFVPILNHLVGGQLAATHVIATVTTFFSPAKTVGNMIQAVSFGFLYTLLALGVSLLSMLTAVYLREQDQLIISHLVTLGIWFAGSTFILSFIKAKFSNPSVGIAVSLAFMVICPVLVREGSTDTAEFNAARIQDTVRVVIVGTMISVFVCFFVWPMTATSKLRSDIDSSLQSTRILLKLLTKTFLLDSDLPEFTANPQLEGAIVSHRKSFTNLQLSLNDAKHEFYDIDMLLHADGYHKVVESLQRLAQHIGGLRSSCGIQFEMMRLNGKQPDDIAKASYGATNNTFLSKRHRNPVPETSDSNSEWHIKPDHQRKKMEHELKREMSSKSIHAMDIPGGHSYVDKSYFSPVYSYSYQPSCDLMTVPEEEEEEEEGEQTEQEEPDRELNDSQYEPQETREVSYGPLSEFIYTIRPPMKSLAFTCKQTIIHLQAHFNDKTTSTTPSFVVLKQNLTKAMALFEESQHAALSRMFLRKMDAQAHAQAQAQVYAQSQAYMPSELHFHLIKQFPVEDVYLVYFFVFCLLEFAKELKVLVESVESVFDIPCQDDSTIQWLKRVVISSFCSNNAHEKIFTKAPNNHNTLNTLHTPTPKTYWRRFFLKMWSFFSWFRNHEARYAAKSTFTALAIAVLAFIPYTRPYFQSLRMEWTLITVLAAMTPTVGGTNLVAVLRVLATMVGSIIALGAYLMFPANGPVLLFITWAFSLGCFWVTMHHRHGRFGLFSLLAYNLVVLYKFNQRHDHEIDVIELTWMRCFTVSLGVLISLVITAYVWPYEARKELRRGLSDFLLRLSWLYKQLVSEYSETPQAEKDADALLLDRLLDNPLQQALTDKELTALALHKKRRSIALQRVELELQVNLVNLQDLLNHAPNEPRLKGPFPVKTYEAMLSSCQDILDKFLSIRIVVLKDVWTTQVRGKFILPANKELMEMAGNVLLYFYLLASALQLKTPLPPYLPPAEKARTRLVSKLQTLPHNKSALSLNHLSANDECFMVYYAYVMMMENVIVELDHLGKHMKELFGSLIPDDQWARSFGQSDIERQRDGSGRVY
ncbi:hypothetical protein PHYBLDRAFT_186217 [Phycomyces blakesleeanus NRRL 1555(-)]|uniref:Uncharacterized protein n=1 Tax=Phycomyces blakesleeanus (strain ATCC 8743b / DSM 1359 / FGSC 10004 / NBRC 33097 / NRRL 1555) TaxID=763407 RepID=A0A167NMG9_PHYB8|nr:hypothetical protein PHYBLDRAFT_186217 [Phycomyces blakesleeanus NRRL 1555(-)]OAD76278.1 hypothetical protein PHYBLDRAFT_186217 [Phycomyces blakesleeanus NRRL 1555(-)]|eukprot:XP_018294318.1 hypothetical protein PHYBLDRAFT_186217 [Phycomyces blakesleeanus NRRL 1555(-)]